MTTITKDSHADLDYTFDWSHWLGSDTIVSSTWIPAGPSGLVAHDDSVDETGKKTAVWLSGGNDGYSGFLVTNRIVTSAGRQEERSLIGRVSSR
jgi:hypothetical protein